MRTPGDHSRPSSPSSRGSTSHDSPGSSVVSARSSGPRGGGDHRAHLGGEVGGRTDAQAADGVGEAVEEVGAVEQRRLDDGQRGGRALLAGVPERRAHEVAQGEVDVGGLADDERVLAARLGQQVEVGSPAEEQPGRVVGPGEHDAVDAGVGDEVAPDVVVGAVDELHDVVGDAGGVGVADDLDADRDGLRRRLQQHRVAGGEGGDDAVGRDGEREVPRPGDEDDAERVGRDPGVRAARRGGGCTPPPTSRSRSPPRPRGRPRGPSCAVSWAITAMVRPRSAAITLGEAAQRGAAFGRRRRPPAGGAGAGPLDDGVDAGRRRHERWARRRAVSVEVTGDPVAVGAPG